MPQIRDITLEDIDAIIGRDEPASPPEKHSSNGHRPAASFDVPAWLRANAVDLRGEPREHDGGWAYDLAECPFCQGATGRPAILVGSNGSVGFKCFESPCSKKTFAEFKRKIDPNNCSPSGTTKPDEPVRYEVITAAELDAGNYEVEFLIDGTLVRGQPLILAGGKKCLKTNGLMDAAISLATRTQFLGQIDVYQQCRVLVMSGESGLGTIQETCRRICRSKGFDLRDVDGLSFSPDLPRIGDPRHLEALEQAIINDGIEVLAVDPAYLCMDLDGREGSLFATGPQLLGLANTCQRHGVTVMLCHHTKRGVVDPFAPPELEDIAWAGFQEFARQWWLLGRREKFDPDSDGVHKLWLNIGGSAGFASLWAVDITEGKYPAPRRWEVTLQHAAEARQQATEKQEQVKAEGKERKHSAKVELAKSRIQDALRSVPGNEDTERNIKQRAGMDGEAYREAQAYLLRTGKLIPVEIERANKRKYPGFKYVFDDKRD